MAPFELAQPEDLEEAIALLDAEDTRALSGGTALMLMMKAGVLRPGRLVSLARLGLDRIEGDDALRIGAMTSLRSLEKSETIKKGWPAITRALRTLSNVRVRNVATVGGALAHADPHMDLPPLLSALGARVRIKGKNGERTAAVEDLYAGYLETTLRRGELITGVEVPPLGKRRAAYLKCTTRSADDWPAVGIAVVSDFQQDIRIFVSAATDRPIRLTAAEALLKEGNFDVKRAAEAALSQVHIESDLHGSADYKKQLLRVYLGRAIHEARNAVH
ncbi:MAG TPA: xanthine dehydrogenase family protein subunit M [Burkholderiales bacterium]|nr:xanthine dehydrogenase family protein subunit M [Burkholderiales bacterium]